MSDAGATPAPAGRARPSAGAVHPAVRWALGTWAVAAVYLLALLDRRWIPHDEGTLGQTAWRILLGEVPHRDFDAMYTGLLGYVNAGAMAVLGETLLAPRMVLMAAFLAWIPAVWALARRFADPPAAALVTLLCAVLGPPNYPAAMPSWYNLFLATWGLLALVRAAESGWRPRWLLAAGACAGASVLFKVAGLYLLAAALFFALHASLWEERSGGVVGAPHAAAAGPGRSRLLPRAAALLGLGLLAMVLLLVRSQLATPGGLVHYVLPVAAPLALLGVAAWKGRAPHGAGEAARRWAWLLAGFAVAVAPFLAWFAAAGALDDLYRGVFVLPTLRLERAARQPLLLPGAAAVVPLVLCAVEPRLSRRARLGVAGVVAAGGAVLLALVHRLDVYVRLWYALTLLVPLVAAAAAVVAARHAPLPRRTALLAALWVAGVTSLIQFPFASPIYFLYVAPLAVLAWLGAAAVRHGGRLSLAARPVTVAVWAVALGFMVLGPNRGRLFQPGSVGDTVPLRLERARLDVQPPDAAVYELLVRAVREHARGGYMYATPDAPEVYFLAGLRNPTRTLFEIFDPPGAPGRILDLLERRNVDVVVLNDRAGFSPPPPPTLVGELVRRFPHATRVGHFTVRWRDG